MQIPSPPEEDRPEDVKRAWLESFFKIEERFLAAEGLEYEKELTHRPVTPSKLVNRPKVIPEIAIAEAADKCVTSQRDAIRELDAVIAYLDNADIANRIKTAGGSPETLKFVFQTQRQAMVDTMEVMKVYLFGQPSYCV